MRRTDREITDFEEIICILKKSSVCRVAFFDDSYPYIVPLNFGVETDGKKVVLYFHCANEGKKLDLLKRNNKVAFEMDCPDKFFDGEKACYSTMEFDSICGNGSIEIVGDDEKIHALTMLMQQYSDKKEIVFDDKVLKAVTVLRMTVNEITGKRLKNG